MAKAGRTLFTGKHDFTRLAVHSKDRAESFRLIDVGCSGGVHEAFRAFGERLTAWAFDTDSAECKRLQAAETLAGIRYIAGAVGLPDDHSFLAARAGRPTHPGNPWGRLSVAETLRLRGAATAPSPAPPPTVPPKVVDRIDLVQFLITERIDKIDFLKIDVDGEDFAILSGLDGRLATLGLLGVGIEVNFFGTDDPTDNTLHNVDRFMRRQGYELFGLTTRHYSAAALPSRYIYGFPTETKFGRLLQGDALYMRDLCAPEQRPAAERLAPSKLLKAAAVFSLCDLPDCAAEILVTFRDRLSPLIDVDAGLDLLTVTTRDDDMPARYRDYRAAFLADAPCFYTLPFKAGAPDAETSDAVPDSSPPAESNATRSVADQVHGDNARAAPLHWLIDLVRRRRRQRNGR